MGRDPSRSRAGDAPFPGAGAALGDRAIPFPAPESCKEAFRSFFPAPRPERDLEFRSYEESLRELDLFSQEKTEGGLSLMHVNISRAGAKSVGPDFFQRCPSTR